MKTIYNIRICIGYHISKYFLQLSNKNDINMQIKNQIMSLMKHMDRVQKEVQLTKQKRNIWSLWQGNELSILLTLGPHAHYDMPLRSLLLYNPSEYFKSSPTSSVPFLLPNLKWNIAISYLNQSSTSPPHQKYQCPLRLVFKSHQALEWHGAGGFIWLSSDPK
jgi:hypothetical protein